MPTAFPRKISIHGLPQESIYPDFPRGPALSPGIFGGRGGSSGGVFGRYRSWLRGRISGAKKVCGGSSKGHGKVGVWYEKNGTCPRETGDGVHPAVFQWEHPPSDPTTLWDGVLCAPDGQQPGELVLPPRRPLSGRNPADPSAQSLDRGLRRIDPDAPIRGPGNRTGPALVRLPAGGAGSPAGLSPGGISAVRGGV